MINCLALSPSLDVSYLVDSVRLGGITVPTSVHRTAGGKSLNVARAAAALGAEVSAFAILGGHTGALIQSLLEPTQIALTAVQGRAETRSCLSIAAEDSEQLTEIYERATPIDPSSWRSLAEAVRVSPRPAGDWLAISGSMPAGLPLDELCLLLREQRAAGMRIALDSHGPALARLIGEVQPDVVKINRAEATGLLRAEGDSPLPFLAAGVRNLGSGLAVITDGVEGACAVDENGELVVPAVRVRGRYPVGSGDCFLAGLLVGLDRGDTLRDALHLASAVAAANAMVPGAGTFEPAHLEDALHL